MTGHEVLNFYYITKFLGESDTPRCDQPDPTIGSLGEFEWRDEQWLKNVCSSNEGLIGSGADPEVSSERPGASSLLNNVLCEKGYRGTPTCSGCFWAVIRTISRISPCNNFSWRAAQRVKYNDGPEQGSGHTSNWRALTIFYHRKPKKVCPEIVPTLVNF